MRYTLTRRRPLGLERFKVGYWIEPVPGLFTFSAVAVIEVLSRQWPLLCENRPFKKVPYGAEHRF